MIGFEDSTYVQKINVSIACWSLFCGVTVSLLVVRIRRRVMYLACTISLLLCYVAWTVAMQQAQTAEAAGTPNNAANIAVLFFIYAYSPCYNMGYNALTYSKSTQTQPVGTLRLSTCRANSDRLQPTWLKSGRTLSVPAVSPSSSFGVVLPASSPPLSTPSASTMLAGNTSSRTAAGLPTRSFSCTSSSPRPLAVHWKNLPSVCLPSFTPF